MDMCLARGDGGCKADVGRNTPDFTSPADGPKYVHSWKYRGTQHRYCVVYRAGAYGNISAATVGMQLLSSFHSIRFGLMVGIGGGVPSSNADIRLGDIVVSQPSGHIWRRDPVRSW